MWYIWVDYLRRATWRHQSSVELQNFTKHPDLVFVKLLWCLVFCLPVVTVEIWGTLRESDTPPTGWLCFCKSTLKLYCILVSSVSRGSSQLSDWNVAPPWFVLSILLASKYFWYVHIFIRNNHGNVCNVHLLSADIVCYTRLFVIYLSLYFIMWYNCDVTHPDILGWCRNHSSCRLVMCMLNWVTDALFWTG